MKRTPLMLCLAFGILNWSLQAQNPTTPSLSRLFQKVRSYPGLIAEKEGIEAAKLNVKITKREYLPDLNFQAQNTIGTYRGTAGGFFPTNGIFNVSGNGISGNTAVNTFISATLQWEFWQFGKHQNQVELTKIQQEKAVNQYQLEEITLKRKVTTAFLNWQFSQYMLNWAQQEHKRNQHIFKLSQSLVKSGLTSAADSLAAKTKLKQAAAHQNKWAAQAFDSRQKIRELTGILPQMNQPAAAFLQTALETSPLFNEEAHPLVAIKVNQQEALKKRQENINRQMLPNLSLLAGGLIRGVGFSEQGQAFADSYQLPNRNYLVGLGLTWNISQFYTRGLRHQKLNHHQQQIEAQKTQIKRHLEQQKSSLKNHLKKVRQEIKMAEESYRAAQKSFDLFQVRYEKGLIDLTALLQIQEMLQLTERSLIAVYYRYWQYWNRYAYTTADYRFLTSIFN